MSARLSTMKTFAVLVGGWIILSLAAIDWRSVDGAAKETSARTQIANFLTALEAYQRDVGTYPAQEAGLRALLMASGEPGWQGPYLPQDIPLDPWGHPYRYIYPGHHGSLPDIVCDAPKGLIESWNFQNR
jgi:type II secretion system protein G